MDVNENDLVQTSFAIVQLRPGTETKLFKVLLENGYTNVSFTNALGEMVKTINDQRVKSIDTATDDHTDIDGRFDDEEVDVEVDDSAEVEADVASNGEIAQQEKDLLENFYIRKPLSIDTGDDENEERQLLEEIKERKLKSAQSIDPPSPPIEFASLTLPTVLWGATTTSDHQPKFPMSSFPYNPFLSPGANPFLPYLTPAVASQSALIKGDSPYLPASTAEAILSSWNRQPQPHHHASSNNNLLDTPPATPRGSRGSASSDPNHLITGAKLRQRGRQLRRNERDTSAYASCRLCRNRILANRLSNLHNHVRRHAVLKQFHCCHCSYAHTEVAKVRLHMLHNHKDDRSQPLDKRNDDMETAWSMLMRECFPGYA